MPAIVVAVDEEADFLLPEDLLRQGLVPLAPKGIGLAREEMRVGAEGERGFRGRRGIALRLAAENVDAAGQADQVGDVRVVGNGQ